MSALARERLKYLLASSYQLQSRRTTATQILANRGRSSLPNYETRHYRRASPATAMMGEQPPSHHGNAVTSRLGRAYTSKTEVELSRPRAIVRTDVLYPPKTPTDIRIYKDRFRFGPMVLTHGNLLSALRANTPRVASGRRDPAGQQKGIASDGGFYLSALVREQAVRTWEIIRHSRVLAEVDALFAARTTVRSRLAVMRFDTLSVRAVIVVMIHVAVLGWFFIRLCVVRIDFSHVNWLLRPVKVALTVEPCWRILARRKTQSRRRPTISRD